MSPGLGEGDGLRHGVVQIGGCAIDDLTRYPRKQKFARCEYSSWLRLTRRDLDEKGAVQLVGLQVRHKADRDLHCVGQLRRRQVRRKRAFKFEARGFDLDSFCNERQGDVQDGLLVISSAPPAMTVFWTA